MKKGLGIALSVVFGITALLVSWSSYGQRQEKFPFKGPLVMSYVKSMIEREKEAQRRAQRGAQRGGGDEKALSIVFDAPKEANKSWIPLIIKNGTGRQLELWTPDGSAYYGFIDQGKTRGYAFMPKYEGQPLGLLVKTMSGRDEKAKGPFSLFGFQSYEIYWNEGLNEPDLRMIALDTVGEEE